MGAPKGKKSLADPLETGREYLHTLGKRAAKGAAYEAEETGKTFLQQLLGLNLESKAKPTHADKAPEKEAPKNAGDPVEIFNYLFHKQANPEANAAKPKAHAEKVTHKEAAMNYSREIAHSSERASKGELSEMDRNIKQIKQELAQLVASSQELKLQFAEAGVDTGTPTVGKYQVNFFEWMLVVIRQARQKVEDSGAWLNTVKGKGGKKGYWGMFKQHGTTFGMSGERSVATQVG